MNYILHLNAVFEQFSKDSRLNPTHISLYMALFQFWNINRFPNKFHISRDEVMQLAKIGSKATYHKCLSNLNDWKYILYFPSHNPFKGSEISLLVFGTTTKQVVDKSETSNEQAVVSNTNNNKQKTNLNKRGTPKNELEVLSFFKAKNKSSKEGLKFYHHYQSLGWKINGKAVISDWRALAEKWLINGIEVKQFETLSHTNRHGAKDNLKTTKDKNYGEPL
ncbi:hypothetical protein SB49_14290 [Sediminicola sp. YIK13]|uniref:hypothetical protein n=1 Tax=Sediminicola sp. YIK13 TaxID=1453352 RepID=UPI000720F9A5|nr:hypothetical protein [Sediminicola sp. YIK13]ALM08835.1 hypothetical protein SB49_14290 [Sediminicola sp. YIK13]